MFYDLDQWYLVFFLIYVYGRISLRVVPLALGNLQGQHKQPTGFL